VYTKVKVFKDAPKSGNEQSSEDLMLLFPRGHQKLQRLVVSTTNQRTETLEWSVPDPRLRISKEKRGGTHRLEWAQYMAFELELFEEVVNMELAERILGLN
jgi:hypothetical protein